jgi:hypothetical protein
MAPIDERRQEGESLLCDVDVEAFEAAMALVRVG